MSRKLKFWKTLCQWKLHRIDTISTAILLYKDGYSLTDISVCMCIPYGTVKRWVEGDTPCTSDLNHYYIGIPRLETLLKTKKG